MFYRMRYLSTNFHRIRLRILFCLKISPNTNMNSWLFEYILISNYSFSNGDLCKILISNSCSNVLSCHFLSGNNLLLFIQLILPQNVLCIFLFWLWLWLFLDVSKISSIYPQDIPMITAIHPQYIPKISQKYSPDILLVWSGQYWRV